MNNNNVVQWFVGIFLGFLVFMFIRFRNPLAAGRSGKYPSVGSPQPHTSYSPLLHANIVYGANPNECLPAPGLQPPDTCAIPLAADYLCSTFDKGYVAPIAGGQIIKCSEYFCGGQEPVDVPLPCAAETCSCMGVTQPRTVVGPDTTPCTCAAPDSLPTCNPNVTLCVPPTGTV